MISKENINIIFTKKEINYFWILLIGIFFTSILDVISFGVIIPVFNIIFLDKVPSISLYFINTVDFQLTFNLKVILLVFLFLYFI